jgi:tetratricopeptide (TPR) repeat protein
MTASDFATPEELLAFVQERLRDRDLDAAARAVADVPTCFPESPLAHHIEGFVWEQMYLERRALGEPASLDLYEGAEKAYRRALACAGADTRETHLERLFACLFVLGTQLEDSDRLDEALRVARERADAAEGAVREACLRDCATVATAIARKSQDLADWERARTLFEATDEPTEAREALFYQYYRGLTARALGQANADQQTLRQAVGAFRAARAHGSVPGLDYLLADCLLQLQEPTAAEVLEMKALVPELVASRPGDRLLAILGQRWRARQELLEGEGHAFDLDGDNT